MTESLEKQKAYYDNNSYRTKTEVVLNKDIQSLNKIVEAEEVLLVKIGQEEQKRMGYKQSCKECGMSEDITISGLVRELRTGTVPLQLRKSARVCDVIEKQKVYNKTTCGL